MGRINQIRDVILERRKEDRNVDLMVKEQVAIFLSQSIHSSAGNKAGISAASQFSLRPKEKKKISARQATALAGGSMVPAFTPEEVAAEVERLREEK